MPGMEHVPAKAPAAIQSSGLPSAEAAPQGPQRAPQGPPSSSSSSSSWAVGGTNQEPSMYTTLAFLGFGMIGCENSCRTRRANTETRNKSAVG